MDLPKALIILRRGNERMKKVLSMVALLMLIIVVSGCGGSGDSKTYIQDTKGVSVELTYYYDGDTVTKQVAKNTINYIELGQSKDDIKLLLDASSKVYQGIKGVEESVKYDNDKAIETLTIDYTKVDFEALQKLPGVTLDKETVASKKVSLEKTEALLKKAGYTLKK